MAIGTGSQVRTAKEGKWKTWGWISKDGGIVRCHIEPDRIYTVTVASSRFKQADGTYQSCTKMTDPNTGLEVMCEREVLVEVLPAT